MESSVRTIPEIAFSSIVLRDSSVLTDLLHAGMTNGCFLLNLQGSKQDGISEKASQIFGVAQTFFDEPLSQKLEWEMDKWGEMQIGGYKPIGKHSGVGQGTRDGFENFLVPLDALQSSASIRMPWPKVIRSRLDLFMEFELACCSITREILAALSSMLPAKFKTPLEDLHRQDQPSTTSLAMLKYPVQGLLKDNHMGHMAHTDVGSLTLLFTSSPGLEVYSGDDVWTPLCPSAGSVLVNVGDALRFISKQQFKSCLHRVAPNICQGAEAKPRYSIAFFLRPELSARFVDDDGREWSGEEWHRAKYRIFRSDETEQSKSSLLTGRKGYLGIWGGAASPN